MDFKKLHDLSCSVHTCSTFLSENAAIISNFACMLSNKTSNEDFILTCYKNEFHFYKKHFEELDEKYKKLEMFLNENNIKGV